MCVFRADGYMTVRLCGWVKGRGGFVDVCVPPGGRVGGLLVRLKHS